MRRLWPILLLCLTILLALAPSLSAQSAVSDDDVNDVAKRLYCPVCPNTPLDVCETQACQDWREDIRTQLSAGWSEEEVMDYFVERYGERVLAEPARSGFTSLVWVLPVVASLLGLAIVAQALRRWRARRQPSYAASSPAAPTDAVSPEDRARIERELQELL